MSKNVKPSLLFEFSMKNDEYDESDESSKKQKKIAHTGQYLIFFFQNRFESNRDVFANI